MPKVLLLFPTSITTCRWMLRGILRYVQEFGPWELHILEDREGEQRLSHAKAWGAKGIIGYVHNKAHADIIRQAHVPSVIVDPLKEYLRPANPLSRLSRVACDSHAIGRIAADYFLERHYTNFAFVGEINAIHWSRDRDEAFTKRVKEHGFTCQSYPTPSLRERRDFAHEEPRLCDWLKKLPKPVAILTAWDVRGRQVLSACIKTGIAVPHEVTLLSVDNDEIICETASPPMSSIEMGSEEACYQGAKILDQQMRNPKKAKQVIISYSATKIVTRRSSEAYRIDDPFIVKALDFIRINVGAPMSVHDVVNHLGLSRRSLEIRAQKSLGRTIHDEINRVRLEHAQALLKNTRMTISEISYACGFAGPSHFGRRFQDSFNCSPKVYRADVRSVTH